MKQLFTLAPRTFSLVFLFAGGGRAERRSAESMPEYVWPDGRWCMDVALYLHELLARGCEHAPRGGTLGTYGAYLAPLVRFCFSKRSRRFLSLTDADFSKQVKALYDARTRKDDGTLVPTNNRTTVRTIACVWLDFLSFLGKFYGKDNFVGDSGTIRASRVKVQARPSRNGANSATYAWSHRSIQSADPYRKRHPLRDSQLRLLREAAHKFSSSHFQRRRRLVMLELFDVIGLRRIEAHLLRVSDVMAAIAIAKAGRPQRSAALLSQEPDDIARRAFFLSFRMRKQPDGDKERLRHAPISAVSLQFFEEYLKERSRHLKRIGRTESDSEGAFFINIITGTPVAPNFFTQEFHVLASEAGIREPCSPHMARGRYLTREFVRLIRAHHLESLDDWRRALLNSEVFLEQVAEISGHTSTESLKLYINLAFAEVAQLAATLSRVEAQRNLDAATEANHRYLAAISAGDDPKEAGEQLSRAISALSLTPRR